MQVSLSERQVKAADISLDRMTDSTQVPEKQKLAEVSRQFEAILLRQILTEAEKSQMPKKGESNSAVTQIYKDMVTNQLADSISRSGEVGLSSVLEVQLGRQFNQTSNGNAGGNGKGIH